MDGNENPVAADALYASRAKDKVLIYDTPLASGLQTPHVFAEGLAIPLGVLPYGDGCYVQHGHDVAFLHDTDGDGKADQSEVILTGFGVQDSHLFPHQFTRGPGGYLLMAQGAFNYGKVHRGNEPAEKAVQFDQTRMCKFHPDGSAFEITSNGPCNIWGLVLNSEGEIFIQEANDFGYPVMPFHEFGNYPGCSDRQWKTYSPEFPGTAHFAVGGTGLSGLALTDATGPFTEAWRDVMLLANPITNRVNAIKMHRQGPRLELEHLTDFMESTDPWFRPVAVTIGPDGYLYIVDWYNKIISHNEVPRNHPDRDRTRGRIWRVKPVDGKPYVMTDFTKLSSDELIAKLGGPSVTQSHLAWQTLFDRSASENLVPKLSAIVKDLSQAPARRIQAEWAMELQARDPEIQRIMTKDADPNVRREGLRSLSSNPAWTIHNIAQESGFKALANDPDPTVRAELIKNLGHSYDQEAGGETTALQLMLSMAKEPLAAPIAPSTRDGKPIKVREAYDRDFERYLVRLFLEPHADLVAKFLDSAPARELPVEAQLLASLALDPKTSASRVAQLLPRLQRPPESEEVLRLAQFPDEPGVGEALQSILQSPATSSAVLETLLAVRTKLDAAKITPLLAGAAAKMLGAAEPARQEFGIKIVSAYRIAALEPQVLALLQNGATPTAPAVALSALRALAELGSTQSELFANLAANSPDAGVRREALTTLTASKAPDAAQRVLALYPKLPAVEQRRALDRLASSKVGATAVVAALTAGAVPKNDLEAGTLDRLQAVLGPEDSALAKLVDSLGALFHPVLALDGSDAAWAQTNLTLTGPCTIETWIRLNPQDRAISNADGIGGAPNQVDLNFAGGRFRVYLFGTGDLVEARQPIMPGLWTHVAATRNEAGLWQIFIDGEPDNISTKPAPDKIENFRIGWTSAPGGTKGAFSEYRIWNRARTVDEIRATCNRSLAGGGTDSTLIFSGAEATWPGLQAGAKVVKTSDFPPVLTAAEAKSLDEQYAHYRQLANAPGDVEKGRAAAALCMACHLMGPTGGNIGPNLSGVGAMGTEGILRNVLEPSAAMENAYRIYRVELNNGDLVDALFVSEDKDAVVVRLPGVPDRRLLKSEIHSAKYLRRSLMPEGLLGTMPPESVSDLFAFLRTLK